MRYKKLIIVFINLIIILHILSSSVVGAYLIDRFDMILFTSEDDPELQERGGKIVGTIQVIGVIVSIGALMILGIKYMLGSSEERAEYKKTMLPYLAGIVLIFGFTNITQAIYKFADGRRASYERNGTW